MTDIPTDDPEDASTESFDGKRPDSEPLPVSKLGSFELLRQIGGGGMGIVYEAYDESMKRTVALKVLHPSLDFSAVAQSRFAREAWIVGKLEHPNIIKVFSRGEESGFRYFVMERADGGSLAEHIKQRRASIPEGSSVSDTARREYIDEMVRKFADLADALDHIHQQGFIHRDIKPHNILISGKEKQLKLSDFGIAHAEDMTKMTKAGDFIGTVKYMSPELLTAHRAKVDKRTDIYSLGVTLYEALTLKLPFDADTDEKYISKILTGNAVPARKRNPRIPRDLETVILKATDPDPQRRYQTASAMGRDLRNLLEGRTITARRTGVIVRTHRLLRRHRIAAVLVAVVAVLAIVGVSILYEERLDRIDEEQIIATMRTAVATRTSPFELNPEWERLSEVFYERVKTGLLDSVTVWFYRANSMFLCQFPEYSLTGKGKMWIYPQPLKVVAARDSVERFVAMRSTLELAADSFPYRSVTSFIGSYGSEEIGGKMALDEKLSDLVGSGLGKRFVRVRRITEHFCGAEIFQNIAERRERRAKSESSLLEDAQVVVTPSGDSVLATGRDFACFAFGVPLDFDILVSGTLNEALPTYIDTVVDSFAIFVFDQYPDGYPREIVQDEYRDWFADSLVFQKVTVKWKLERGPSGQVLTTFDVLAGVTMPIPIVGEFKVSSKTGDQLLRGQLQIRRNHLFFPWFFDMIYCGEAYEGLGRFRDDDSSAYMSCSSEFVDTYGKSISELAELGEVEARLQIAPSIEAARSFGEIYEYWGDTLRFDILFQAIDTSGTLEEVQSYCP